MIKQFTSELNQKDKTLKQLYGVIYQSGPITKPELANQLELKKSTCTRLIDELLEKHLIIESGYASSKGGRKPVLFSINPTTYYVFGIDISRTYTKILLLDLSSTTIDSARLPLTSTTDADIVLQFLKQHIIFLMKKHSLSKENILGVGIGSVGPLDRENGLILDPVFMPSTGWEQVNIKDFIERELDMQVVLDDGVNTALLAEYQLSSLHSYSNIAHIIKGVGSRTGMMIDGRLTCGSDKLGRLGQGHMIVDLHGKMCVCGSRGCVQAYSSIPAIMDEVMNQLKEGKSSIVQDQVKADKEVQFQDIYEAVHQGDELCCNVIKEAAYYTGLGLSNLINVLHFDLIILTGPVYRHLALFYETVKEAAAQRNKVIYPNHQTEFSRGTLGENAIAIGAGIIVMNHYITDAGF